MPPPTRANPALTLAGESRYRLLVEAVMDYAIYLLDTEGRITSWNRGAERFKGYASHEVIGRHFSLFYTDEDRLVGVPQKALETARREGRFEAEGWRVHKSGRKFWCSVVIDAIHDDDGNLLGFAKITRDITDKKKAQEDIDAAHDALHHAQKLEALGRLTGGVAHDFNNFLTTIRFATEMLSKPEVGNDKRKQLATLVAATVERASHLTAQLLAYSRRQPLKPARFEVRSCIDGMRDIFATTVGAAIRIEYEFPEHPLYICADPSQLENALLNIVINARDAMPAGGRLIVAVRREISTLSAGDAIPTGLPCVEIELRDTGFGMTPEVLSHVFEPFFTTKSADKGTGLGLSQVFGFAKQSGGDVRVSSEVGKGSAFTVLIPEDGLSGGLQGATPASTDTPRTSQQRILLVEDDASVGAILRSLLEDIGHEVLLRPNAESALRLLERSNGGVDFMITDVEMAGLDGLELAKRVRQTWPHIRVALTTGADGRLRHAETQAFPLLPKPWSLELLIDVLKNS
ncbi:PAS domain S-box protein [Achromobacter marplatensis]|uniref:histidine kinase n=1 Tax=Achromobacter marplatensis TaxID=470868 RepID=A0AA43B154_9BURK|nr:PAS domain S-box protein [Achromobacter marplatensis]MDH2054096.1 PAS domain S-box protein [Achromobacter marplatensis]